MSESRMSFSTLVIVWNPDDVMLKYPDLSIKQAQEVLEFVMNNYDPQVGVNWDIIAEAVALKFPVPGVYR